MLPDRLGYNIDIREVRAVADLARAEDWENVYFEVLAIFQEYTPEER